jgi:hypothetical protein
MEKTYKLSTSYYKSLIKTYCDKARCYTYMHEYAHRENARFNTFLVIFHGFVSMGCATAAFSQVNIKTTSSAFMMTLGIIMVVKGILEFSQKIFNTVEMAGKYEMSANLWENLRQELFRVILFLENLDGGEVDKEIIKVFDNYEKEFLHLIEISPTLPDTAIYALNVYISSHEELKDMAKPDICGSMVSTNNYVKSLTTEKDKNYITITSSEEVLRSDAKEKEKEKEKEEVKDAKEEV